jgi:DNA-binding YbaB/EbfC family protein
MKDMFGMFGKVQEMQKKMQEAQEKLAEITAEGEAGAGMVKAKVNGKHQVLAIDIDDELMKPEDKEMLQDLVVAAVNKAMENVEEQSKAFMQKSTEGLIPNIPGLGNMMGGK